MLPQSAALAGIEIDPTETPSSPQSEITFTPGHFRLIQAVLRDDTDVHAELLQENQWLLHSRESDLKLQGNAFALENTVNQSGTVYLKLAPLPEARTAQSEWDVRVTNRGSFELGSDDGYQWASEQYTGGKWGRIAAMHRLQRAIRPYNPAQDGLFLTNTWGDRNRDAHLNPQFMAREIEAAALLGADVVQIDDGWQQGVTANSAAARGGGAWDGFYASDPDFWTVHKERFPQGLQSLVEIANGQGIQIGLWFAPDSSNEAANWERDVAVLLGLHRELGINFFKVDALKIGSAQSEANFQKLFETVRRESNGAVSFDFDITAERRFGYFGMVEPGRLFVENRYTDWRSYWPHHTLRVAWQLAHWVDPVRLRLEWLNNSRNDDKYPNDPLAPSKYAPATLFATTMFCSPLGWFENQNLPASYFEEAAPLIKSWKAHREAIQNGNILPVGEAPDGYEWTGFVSINQERNGGYAVLFRELNQSAQFDLKVPLVGGLNGEVELLGGQGTAGLRDGVLSVNVSEELGFVWVRLVAE